MSVTTKLSESVQTLAYSNCVEDIENLEISNILKS